ncbi:MAG: hypothetical protein AAFQ92_29500 [Bacteroidota bacterium]
MERSPVWNAERLARRDTNRQSSRDAIRSTVTVSMEDFADRTIDQWYRPVEDCMRPHNTIDRIVVDMAPENQSESILQNTKTHSGIQ